MTANPNWSHGVNGMTLEELIDGARRDLNALEDKQRTLEALAELTTAAAQARRGEPVLMGEASTIPRLDVHRALAIARQWIRRRYVSPPRVVHHEILVAIGVLVTAAGEVPDRRPVWDRCPSCGAAVGERCRTSAGEKTAIHLKRERIR